MSLKAVCKERLAQSSQTSALAILRPANKERLGRGGVVAAAAGGKCKLLAVSAAGLAPRQERIWLTYLNGVLAFVLLGIFSSPGIQ